MEMQNILSPRRIVFINRPQRLWLFTFTLNGKRECLSSLFAFLFTGFLFNFSTAAIVYLISNFVFSAGFQISNIRIYNMYREREREDCNSFIKFN